MDNNLALFCDFENIARGVHDAKFSKFDITRIIERTEFAERANFGGHTGHRIEGVKLVGCLITPKECVRVRIECQSRNIPGNAKLTHFGHCERAGVDCVQRVTCVTTCAN